MEQCQVKMIGDTILPSKPLTRSYIHTSSHDTIVYMTLGQVLDEAAAKCPDHVAFILCETGERLTYRIIRQKAREYAKGLLVVGMSKGDVMCLSGMTNSDWLHLYFAAAYIGVVIHVVPSTTPYGPIFKGLSAKSGCRLVVVGPRDENKICDDVSKIFFDELRTKNVPRVEFIYCQSGDFENEKIVKERKIKSLSTLALEGEKITEETFQAAFNNVLPEDPYILLATSGSTGLPKLIAWDHKNLVNFGKFNYASKFPGKDATAENPAVVGTLDIWGDDLLVSLFVCVGVYHNDKIRVVFFKGDICDKGLAIEDSLIKVLQNERCTHCMMWPHYFIDLITCPNLDKYDLSSVRVGLLGSQHCSPELFDKMFRIFPELIHAYAGTEPNVVTCTTSDYMDRKTRVETVGHPLPFYEVKIADDNGRILPVDTPGEVCCKGWGVFHSYWNDPELTKKAYRDGWYLTGDIGTINSEGYLKIIERKADVIRFNRHGEPIYPGPIEKAIRSHPKVESVQVIGVPVDYVGDELIACVIMKENEHVSEEELKANCRDALQVMVQENQLLSPVVHFEMWVPERFIFLNEFPRVGLRNKVSKRKLKDIVEKMLPNL